MKRSLLIAYQLATGLSDASTGLLLIASPELALRLMKLHAATEILPFLSYIGTFVLSVGIACLYGAVLAARPGSEEKLEVVWTLTTITRGLVATFVAYQIATSHFEPGWISVVIVDGAIALLQLVGLTRKWLTHVST